MGIWNISATANVFIFCKGGEESLLSNNCLVGDTGKVKASNPMTDKLKHYVLLETRFQKYAGIPEEPRGSGQVKEILSKSPNLIP